jgi:hypothetical protein
VTIFYQFGIIYSSETTNVQQEATMKNIFVFLTIVAASTLFSTTVLSEEKATGLPGDYGQYKIFELSGQKDQCLIVAINCIGGDDTVMKRVERLNNEIGKGGAVYTPEELKSLQDQLNWIYYESEDFPAVRM